MKYVLPFALIFFLVSPAIAQETTGWNLPLSLNDENTKVRFDVDTTWHMVTGHIKGTTGSIQLGNPEDPNSIQAEIHFPVKKIKTGWSSRDNSFYEHMASDKYSEIVLKTSALTGDCLPEKAIDLGCSGQLDATLSIRDVTKAIKIPIEVKKQGNVLLASGKYTLAWAEYNVEDPSMFVAKVQPKVTIGYSVRIPLEKQPASE